eukprot:2657855-Rhodomonas_salina.3
MSLKRVCLFQTWQPHIKFGGKAVGMPHHQRRCKPEKWNARHRNCNWARASARLLDSGILGTIFRTRPDSAPTPVPIHVPANSLFTKFFSILLGQL